MSMDLQLNNINDTLQTNIINRKILSYNVQRNSNKTMKSKSLKLNNITEDNNKFIAKNYRFSYSCEKRYIIDNTTRHHNQDNNNNNNNDKNIFYDNNIIKNEYDVIKSPITSIGIIGFRFNKLINKFQYLLIRRKDTLGYVDFMRGKYQLHNKSYIMNLLNEMTIKERESLKKGFEYNWDKLWDNMVLNQRYLNEEYVSKEKFNILLNGVKTTSGSYNLSSCLKETNTSWDEPEWGFPKGRREYKEKEINTGIREFCEETGIDNDKIDIIYNILPFEEIFNGSNFKCYKHKYYIANINIQPKINLHSGYQKSEVSAVEWKTLDEACESIRDYDVEKKNILKDIDYILRKYTIQ